MCFCAGRCSQRCMCCSCCAGSAMANRYHCTARATCGPLLQPCHSCVPPWQSCCCPQPSLVSPIRCTGAGFPPGVSPPRHVQGQDVHAGPLLRPCPWQYPRPLLLCDACHGQPPGARCHCQGCQGPFPGPRSHCSGAYCSGACGVCSCSQGQSAGPQQHCTGRGLNPTAPLGRPAGPYDGHHGQSLSGTGSPLQEDLGFLRSSPLHPCDASFACDEVTHVRSDALADHHVARDAQSPPMSPLLGGSLSVTVLEPVFQRSRSTSPILTRVSAAGHTAARELQRARAAQVPDAQEDPDATTDSLLVDSSPGRGSSPHPPDVPPRDTTTTSPGMHSMQSAEDSWVEARPPQSAGDVSRRLSFTEPSTVQEDAEPSTVQEDATDAVCEQESSCSDLPSQTGDQHSHNPQVSSPTGRQHELHSADSPSQTADSLAELHHLEQQAHRATNLVRLAANREFLKRWGRRLERGLAKNQRDCLDMAGKLPLSMWARFAPFPRQGSPCLG